MCIFRSQINGFLAIAGNNYSDALRLSICQVPATTVDQYYYPLCAYWTILNQYHPSAENQFPLGSLPSTKAPEDRLISPDYSIILISSLKTIPV